MSLTRKAGWRCYRAFLSMRMRTPSQRRESPTSRGGLDWPESSPTLSTFWHSHWRTTWSVPGSPGSRLLSGRQNSQSPHTSGHERTFWGPIVEGAHRAGMQSPCTPRVPPSPLIGQPPGAPAGRHWMRRPRRESSVPSLAVKHFAKLPIALP
ncbi:hypothetical protein EV126DRAFT_120363 [Verticillium dahliae]|nr:hypothetical protein EV126DRAFT_120363 [Verticillium dahliae]